MRSTIKKITKYFILFYFTLYCSIWAASPTIIQYYISDYLEGHELVLSSDSSIRYNPFLAHLEIHDLQVAKRSHLEEPVFSLKELNLEVRLYQLFLEQVYVSEFIIDGLYLNIQSSKGEFEVAGVDLPLSSEANASTEAKESNDKEFPFRLDMPELTLKNSELELFVDDAPHSLKLKSFVITDLGATLNKQDLLLQIDSEVDHSSLSLDIKADLDKGDGLVFVDLKLSKIKLNRFKHFLPESVTIFEGLVSYEGKHTINFKDKNIEISVKDLSLLSENIDIEQDGYHLTLGQEQFNSNALQVTSTTEDTLLIDGKATLSLNDYKTFYKSEEQTLAVFSRLDLTDIEFTSSEGINNLAVEDISLSDAFLSNNIGNGIPALAKFSLLNIKQTKLSPKGVSINEINIAGLSIDAQLNKEKELLNLVDMGMNPSGPDESAEPERIASLEEKIESEAEADFSIALGKFKLTDDINIHFTDNSVQPVYQRHVIIETLDAGPFDSQQPDKESPFTILGKSEKYANFEFSGTAKPFAEIPVYQLKGFFKEVSLPGISAYIKDALQYEIQSGQLDLDIDVSLSGSEIDGDANVLLRGIELTAADDHEAGSMNDQTSVPFNIALGMLKDSDGNVELSLPLSGDINSPSFGLSGFMTLLIKQATISAAKDYLMTTFVPYASVVSIGIAVGEFALKVRINDMNYPPGKVDLQPEQNEFLSQFAALMREKEDVQVKLCPVATAADISKQAGAEITNKADIEKLKAISTKRAHAFKEYMVKKEKIKSSRLLHCTPQINSDEDAKPSLTFST